MSALSVRQPGLLSLLMDAGRYGAHNLGLTTGGPLDRLAFAWANRLVGNPIDATAIEIGFGGLQLEAEGATRIAITGATAPCSLNGDPLEQWRSYDLASGDRLEIGFATAGTRAYLAVAGGFDITPSFGSTATVLREKIGGLDGDKLGTGDRLPCGASPGGPQQRLDESERPRYGDSAVLRVVPGYQHNAFPRLQRWRFFNHEYRVTERSDRMGFRLEGPAVASGIVGMLSEGICLGAIQVPADGQPIVLLHDRQTIGGYPKIGAVIEQDLGALAQLSPGGRVRFRAVDQEAAHNLYVLERARFERTQPQPC